MSLLADGIGQDRGKKRFADPSWTDNNQLEVLI